jgi:hypothetical protein
MKKQKPEQAAAIGERDPSKEWDGEELDARKPKKVLVIGEN